MSMGWTYHGVVPHVVQDLDEGSGKITKAIVEGSTTVLLAYLTWNGVVLGNGLGKGDVAYLDHESHIDVDL